MKNITRILSVTITLIIMVFTLTACGCSKTNSEDNGEKKTQDSNKQEESTSTDTTSSNFYGPLHVLGTNLVDANNNPVQLKGVSSHGLSWFPEYISEDSIKYMKDNWNINVIRLAMYTEEYNGYITGDAANKQALINKIDQGVTAAKNNNMYAIIDWHTLSDNDPNKNIEEAKTFWKNTSSKYADYNNVIYEICNEPNNGTSWDQVKSYADTIIPIIRANDPDAVILVGTPNWCQYVDEASTNPLKYDNIMYTLHFYAATHKTDIRNRAQAALNAGTPLFVSEFSICDASGNGGNDIASANEWISFLEKNKISYVQWNLSNKAESSALLTASCSKTSGWTYEDMSESGKWMLDNMKSN